MALASSAVLVSTAATGGAVYALNGLSGNIQTIDTTELNGAGKNTAPRPPTDTSATNFLIMGSDTRQGQGAGFGSAGGARADTAILVHLYEGRKKAVAVSIPRDSYVTIPACTGPSGQQYGRWTTKFNAAFAIGGPVCTIKTIQSETGLTVDKFIILDFNAVKKVVDVLGGVRVCLTTPVYDPYVPGRGGSGLNLPAGYSTIKGKQALAFVRARESIGDGSDLGRIQRQQEFLSSMIRGIEEKGILTSPTTLYRILGAITSSITTSTDLASVQALSDFALSMADLKPSNLTFVTTPYKLIGDGNVHWTEETAALWKALRDEQPWPPVDASASPSPETSASAEPTETAAAGLVTPPSSVRVTILNGTDSNGLARQVAKELKAEGFIIANVGSAPKKVAATVITYNSKFRAGADTLGYAARTSNLAVDDSLTKTIVLTIGPDWLGIQHVVMPTPSTSAAPGTVNAASNVCSEGNNRVKTK